MLLIIEDLFQVDIHTLRLPVPINNSDACRPGAMLEGGFNDGNSPFEVPTNPQIREFLAGKAVAFTHKS